MKTRRARRFGSAPLASGVVLIGCFQLAINTGCAREEVHSYRVPREFDGAGLLSGNTQEPAEDAQVTWAIPEAWTQLETTAEMRIATFATQTPVEVTVTAFPGDVGGVLANVNRWRGQIGLAQINEESLHDSIEHLENSNVIMVDIAGETQRLIGSIINVGDGQTWFAKAMGESEEVAQIKSDLAAFSASFHLHDSSHNHAPQASAQPQTDTAVDPQDMSPEAVFEPVEEPSLEGLDWKQPAEWTAQENISSILMAAYQTVSGARVTLTALTGKGGGNLGNINRWRGQLGLPPVQSMDDLPTQDIGNNAYIVDLISSDQSARIVAGVVPIGAQTLFFKLTGSVEQTQPELQRFSEFVTGVGLGSQGEP